MDRKEILKALEQHFGVKAKYMGAPSFAYQIEINRETLTIEKDGKIKKSTGDEVQFERLLSNGIEAEEDIKEPVNETNNIGFEVGIPMEGHTGGTLRNLLNMIYSKQTLIKRVFEFEEDIINKDFIVALNEIDIQSIEDFKTLVTVAKEDNISGIDFDFNNNIIIFKFCNYLLDSEKLKAFTQFVALLNKSSKELKYASFKATVTDNNKFTMRTWLIRLGFIGAEYKSLRKVLLKNLEGNGAFRKPRILEVIAEK